MTNDEFLKVITESFCKFLQTGSRSNEKLKILHGNIAQDLSYKLGGDYKICSLGFEEGKEAQIEGRYINKMVDITIKHNNKAIAGIGVKFVMQNYSQNSNNYFENMLGETANIRCNGIPYFQIFIIPQKIPYYENNGKFKHWEEFSQHNVNKYLTLSRDNVETMVHTPTKTLLYVIDLPKIGEPHNKKDYISSFDESQIGKDWFVMEADVSYGTFSNNVIFNDYETFIKKVTYNILSI